MPVPTGELLQALEVNMEHVGVLVGLGKAALAHDVVEEVLHLKLFAPESSRYVELLFEGVWVVEVLVEEGAAAVDKVVLLL